MIVKTRDTVVEINPIGNNVGIKLSGGADSSIVAYMLGVYKKNVRDINIVPITAINAAKPWQHLYAKRVVEFIEKDLDIKFADHIVPEEHADPSAYTEFQEKMMRDLYASNAIDCHFNGINLNPPIDLDPDRKFTYASERDQDGTVKQTVNKKGNKFAPLANVDKRGVAEIYQMFGLMNTLFPLTRSCENKFVAYAEPHCGDECWWCLERKWGFGRLE